VKATPAQFHFHTHSEHVVAGAEYALEMHIVHVIKGDQLPACGDKGCPVVLGIMFALTNDESKVSPELRKIIDAMPLNEGDSNTIQGTIDVNALLPSNRTYVTYEGSLTAPPCT
jgi:carbonic anhydrase